MKMEVARLVLDYLSALVWPLVVIAVALMFKAELTTLLRRVTTIEGAGIKTFFAELERKDLPPDERESLVKQVAQQIAADSEAAVKAQNDLLERFIKGSGHQIR